MLPRETRQATLHYTAMMVHPRMRISFTNVAQRTSELTGKPTTFLFALATLLLWAVTGPVFHYSDTWQLVINTGTTIITFLMVFLIQATQNRDSLAIQAKLDELIKATAARNEFIGIDKLTADQLEMIRKAHMGSDLT